MGTCTGEEIQAGRHEEALRMSESDRLPFKVVFSDRATKQIMDLIAADPDSGPLIEAAIEKIAKSLFGATTHRFCAVQIPGGICHRNAGHSGMHSPDFDDAGSDVLQ